MSTSPSVSHGSIPAGYREAVRWNNSQLGRRIVLVQILAGVLFILGLAVYILLAIGLRRIDPERGLETAAEILNFPYRMGVEIGRQLAGVSSGAGIGMALQAAGNIVLAAGGIFLLQMVVALLHEGVHGLAMFSFGARPTFGFMPKGMMFYATSPGYAYPRAQYLWVAAAPLIILDLLFFLILLLPIGAAGAAILAVLAALNTGGAIGDLWVMTVLRKHPSRAFVVDEKDGMRIFLPEKNP